MGQMKIMKQILGSFINGPVYLILFGLIFFVIGGGLSYKQDVLERNGVQAPGEVIDLAPNCDDDGCTYVPIVNFKTREGKTVSFQSTYSSNPPAYEIGEKVTVYYQPDDPDKAGIKGEGMWFRVIFMIVGGVIAAVGLGMFSTSVVKSLIKGRDL